MRRAGLFALWVGWAVATGCTDASPPEPAGVADFTAAEIKLLHSLSLATLGEVPEQVSNEFATEPRAAQLGRRLFFDPRLSRNGEISCATCHLPELYFTDGQAVSTGLARTTRNAPTVVGAAYGPWQFWDGRRDSLWAQALSPLESSAEMGGDRLSVVRYVTQDPRHREDYLAVFGPPPDFADASVFPERASPYGESLSKQAWSRLSHVNQDQINRAFANVGKALGAYQRHLIPAPARFDRYVEALQAGDLSAAAAQLDAEEVAGLRLFVDAGRTQCLRCHNGPLLTNQSFHDVATSRLSPLPDLGRFLGIQSLLLDPFNCVGPYSAAPPDGCLEHRFLGRRELARERGAFKTPTLREVARTAPYFHDGSVKDLMGVMEHYREPPPDPGSELIALELDDREVAQLVAFLGSLSGGVAPEPAWLRSRRNP